MKLPQVLNFIFITVTVFCASYFIYSRFNNPHNVKAYKIEKQLIVLPKTSLRDSIVNFSMELLGTPYVAAGNGKDGFDCSGFVHYVFKHFKIVVPRSSADFEFFGKEIPIEEVEKGDVLLFLSPTRNAIGHVGIVSDPKGTASDFIHATSGGQKSVVISSLAKEGYHRRFLKAIRIL